MLHKTQTKKSSIIIHHISWGSSVSIVFDYRLDNRGSIPGRGKGIFSLCVQTRSEAHPASYPMDTGGEVQPGCDAEHSPPSSAKVNNDQELYLLSPLMSSMAVARQLYLISHSTSILFSKVTEYQRRVSKVYRMYQLQCTLSQK
jgi:hypothetical protein